MSVRKTWLPWALGYCACWVWGIFEVVLWMCSVVYCVRKYSGRGCVVGVALWAILLWASWLHKAGTFLDKICLLISWVFCNIYNILDKYDGKFYFLLQAHHICFLLHLVTSLSIYFCFFQQCQAISSLWNMSYHWSFKPFWVFTIAPGKMQNQHILAHNNNVCKIN